MARPPRLLLLDDPGAPSRLDTLARDAKQQGATVTHWRGPDRETFEDAQYERSLEPVLEEVDAEVLGGKPGPLRVFGYAGGALLAARIAAEQPERVARLGLAGTTPTSSEVQKAHARDRGTQWERFLAGLPEWEYPEAALRAYGGPALVIEAGGDAAYSPVSTMLWRAWLPEADVLRDDRTTQEALADPAIRARVLTFLLAD